MARGAPPGGVSGSAPGLLAACQAGEPGAFRRLFQARSAQVYRWALFLGLTPADAEDAAQEVLVVASQRIQLCRAEEALTSWLFQVTRRVVANARRRRWWRDVFSASGSDDAETAALEHEDASDVQQELAIRACLAKLPKAQAEVLLLMEVEGHTREEVAEMLSLPPGTVASRLRLARAAFRAAWEADGHAPLAAQEESEAGP